MLFFELFAPFITIVCLIVGARLLMANARMRNAPPEQQPDSLKPPAADRPDAHETGGRRPSMSP